MKCEGCGKEIAHAFLTDDDVTLCGPCYLAVPLTLKALRMHDMIQIEGLYPRNPVTGEVVPDVLQYFAVTKDVVGDTIPPDALLPIPGIGYPAVDGPLRMDRVVSRNLRKIT